MGELLSGNNLKKVVIKNIAKLSILSDKILYFFFN